jgi:hypothetical protein
LTIKREKQVSTFDVDAKYIEQIKSTRMSNHRAPQRQSRRVSKQQQKKRDGTDRIIDKAKGAVMNINKVRQAAVLELGTERLFERLVHQGNLGIFEDDVGTTAIRSEILTARSDASEDHVGGIFST